jgi:hypothetical protein
MIISAFTMAFMISCEDHQTPDTPTLTVEEYFAKVNSLEIYILPQGTNDSIPFGPEYTLYDYFKYNLADVYRRQYNELLKLNPPGEAASAHKRLTESMGYLASSHDYVLTTIPAGTPATADNGGTAYLFQNADVGYARVDQSEALCALATIASKYNITLTAFLGTIDNGCTASNETPQGLTAGSSTSPVSSVSMVHQTLTDSQGMIIGPNVSGFEVSTIYAKANQPLTITFDNRNPAPFVFNIAVYSGEDSRVTKEQLIDQSSAFAGEKVHQVTLNLPSGTYTYLDNVHPVAMRGKIIVVP